MKLILVCGGRIDYITRRNRLEASTDLWEGKWEEQVNLLQAY